MTCFPRVAIVSALLATCSCFISMSVAGAAESISGSGVAIGAQGEVLTNAHVVANCAQITVRSSSGGSAVASLIAHDRAVFHELPPQQHHLIRALLVELLQPSTSFIVRHGYLQRIDSERR